MEKVNYKKLGQACQKFRSEQLNKTQKDVAKDTGLVVSGVSMFENGYSKSTDILLWYIVRGLPVAYITGCIEEV